jgi:hypothetical protein
MPLTDLAIRRAMLGEKIVKLSDGGGHPLWITPDGAKRWRLAYRFCGAQKTLALGVYPEIGLKDARDARGDDPLEVKKAVKVARADEGASTFAAVAAELAEKKRRDQKAAATLRTFDWFMTFAFPALGARPIHEITACQFSQKRDPGLRRKWTQITPVAGSLFHDKRHAAVASAPGQRYGASSRAFDFEDATASSARGVDAAAGRIGWTLAR